MPATEEIWQLEEGNLLKLEWDKLSKVVSQGKEVLPVIVQDVSTKVVLTLAYVDRTALEYTLQKKQVAFYSTSRQELWVKGQTSGDTLELVEAKVNCEQNSLLFIVKMSTEGSCHTWEHEGKHRYSCFYRRIVTTSQLEHIDPLRFLH